jgi:endonuclease YncB( thermonuclease family)
MVDLSARHLFLGQALLVGTVSEATAAQVQVETVRVIHVVDGGTAVVRTSESLNLKVRLQGIEAPACGIPFGAQSQRFLEQLVLRAQLALIGN